MTSGPEPRLRLGTLLLGLALLADLSLPWDRVRHGLDASPATATEKLLLQSKPDAPREQRLLAMRSLGTPEALPFLIDWTADTDAEIGAAARAPIGEIHLHPRR